MDAKRFIAVVLHPRVSIADDPGAERIMELHNRAHERCFIANSVRCPEIVESKP